MSPLFQKMLEDKKSSQSKEMSPLDKEATGSVLHDLMSYLSSMEGDKVKGLKKVTVASNDPKGLVEGLDKAKDIVKDGHEDESEDESMEDPMEEAHESPEEEKAEDEHEAPEADESHDPKELMKQIEMLKAQLASRG